MVLPPHVQNFIQSSCRKQPNITDKKRSGNYAYRGNLEDMIFWACILQGKVPSNPSNFATPHRQ